MPFEFIFLKFRILQFLIYVFGGQTGHRCWFDFWFDVRVHENSVLPLVTVDRFTVIPILIFILIINHHQFVHPWLSLSIINENLQWIKIIIGKFPSWHGIDFKISFSRRRRNRRFQISRITVAQDKYCTQ